MKIFLIGPGGVGKTTCGKILAKLIGYKFIDLDTEFCKRIANIGIYITKNGYNNYCLANSKLFYDLLNENPSNCVFVLSSGFLVHENLNELTAKHQQTLKELGISILLLPDKSLAKSLNIIIPRQMARGFDLNEQREKIKFAQRFPIYKNFGDIKIFSCEKPKIIAEEIKKQIKVFYK